MSAYAAKAVETLRAYLEANLQAELTIVETEDSLAAGALTAPVAYLGYEEPGDNRSPLVEIYETKVDAIDQRNALWAVSAQVDFTHNFASADAGDTFTTMRRYFTAIARCVLKNPTLSGGVVGCILTGADRGTVGDKSAGRHAWRFEWIVTVHSALS